jgi:hypothetical protein
MCKFGLAEGYAVQKIQFRRAWGICIEAMAVVSVCSQETRMRKFVNEERWPSHILSYA